MVNGGIMPVAPKKRNTHFASISSLSRHISEEGLGFVDDRSWKEEWSDRWVVFADLLAFGDRATRSRAVVLNNIIRFDRASSLVAAAMPSVLTQRFSDSTFAITETLHSAIAFSVLLSHTCMAFNKEYIDRGGKKLFVHTIVPRVTIASGSVLSLPDPLPPDARYLGLNPKSFLAGAGIVQAYKLEKRSAGGLVTLIDGCREDLSSFPIRGVDDRVRRGLERWRSKIALPDLDTSDVFCVRGKLLDVPWMLLRPEQTTPNEIWSAESNDADEAMKAYFAV